MLQHWKLRMQKAKQYIIVKCVNQNLMQPAWVHVFPKLFQDNWLKLGKLSIFLSELLSSIYKIITRSRMLICILKFRKKSYLSDHKSSLLMFPLALWVQLLLSTPVQKLTSSKIYDPIVSKVIIHCCWGAPCPDTQQLGQVLMWGCDPG